MRIIRNYKTFLEKEQGNNPEKRADYLHFFGCYSGKYQNYMKVV